MTPRDLWIVVVFQPGDSGQWESIIRVVGLFDGEQEAEVWAERDYLSHGGMHWPSGQKYIEVQKLEAAANVKATIGMTPWVPDE